MGRLVGGFFPPAVLVSFPATSSAAVVQNVTVPLTATILNPCTGDTINFTGNIHFVAAMTPDASGGVPFPFHDNASGGTRGGLPSGITYPGVGGFLFWVKPDPPFP